MPGPPALLLLLLLLAAGSTGAAPLPQTGAGDSPAAELSSSFVILSVCSLIILIVLIANCVSCCKDPEIDFKEFEDNFDDEIDFTPPAEDTPSVQSPAEVFTLSVPNISLPAPSQFQPSVGLKSQVARHSLNYIQEIGNGWFGKVLLGEIYTGTSVARVIVKELKASASPKEQDTFLKNGEPYYILQHPNILQCVGQCVEAIPYLLVFEFCDLVITAGHQDSKLELAPRVNARWEVFSHGFGIATRKFKMTTWLMLHLSWTALVDIDPDSQFLK
uniref:non-specific serine/threonine protein kinase n=1 Tax=Rousettus aegyptiacus TaxID=9407 RepID=A0A7J8FIT9_ROUAE|nr:lemur tyrosine kinase 2 [Rousettus aegyptiacus]